MALELLDGSNYRMRISEDKGSTWKRIDCEVDCSFTSDNEDLPTSCKGDFFDISEAGYATASGTVTMTPSDSKTSSMVMILSKLMKLQLDRTIVRVEFVETKDDGTVVTVNPRYVRGDAFITGNSHSWEDHQFISNSLEIAFTGEVTHS